MSSFILFPCNPLKSQVHGPYPSIFILYIHIYIIAVAPRIGEKGGQEGRKEKKGKEMKVQEKKENKAEKDYKEDNFLEIRMKRKNI